MLPPSLFFIYTFHYVPMIPLAAVNSAVFGVITIILFALTYRYGGKFMYIIAVTGLAEVLGYILRIFATQQTSLGLFIGSSVLLLIAPITLALVNYMVIGKLLMAVNKPFWIMQPRHIARVFLASDIVCLFIQGNGGSLTAITSLNPNIGKALILVGLIVQMAFFAAFTVVTCVIAVGKGFRLYSAPSLRPVFHGLWITIGLLFVRNIYRLVEFSSGTDSYIPTHEWVFTVFETYVIFLCLVFYAIYHFGRLMDEKTTDWRQQLTSASASTDMTTVPAASSEAV